MKRFSKVVFYVVETISFFYLTFVTLFMAGSVGGKFARNDLLAGWGIFIPFFLISLFLLKRKSYYLMFFLLIIQAVLVLYLAHSALEWFD